MPRNGSGQYNPLTNTWNPPVTGVLATGADFQAQLNDISAAITQSVSKDGQTPMTANLPMGNNSIVGIASGTETSPSISANGDTNTGLYFPAADTVAIATGGVKRVEVDANGNLLVGTTSPFAALAVNRAQGGASTIIGVQNDGTAGASTKAGFGFYDGGGLKAALIRTRDGGASPIALETYDTVPLVFGTNNTERARIDPSGNLLVGPVSAALNVPQNGFMLQTFNAYSVLSIGHTTGTGSGAQFLQFSLAGTGIGSITQNGTTAVAYNTSSDYRLKENIQPMTGALAKIAALNPVTYTWKADGSAGEGFIAHELAEVCPSAVTGEKDAVDADGNPQYQGIDTSFLVATLTAALQEAHGLIKDLQSRVDALEAK